MEQWLVIADFPNYAVSSLGRVKRIATEKILRPYLGKYSAVSLYRDREQHTLLVHRLVCAAFHGPQPTDQHEVAHADRDSHNNRKENLRWATHVENEADKILHGTGRAGKPSCVPVANRPRGLTHGRYTKPERTARGELGGRAKLTEEKVKAIRVDKRPRKQIAAEYGITVTMIGYIQRGISWAHVPMPERSI